MFFRSLKSDSKTLAAAKPQRRSPERSACHCQGSRREATHTATVTVSCQFCAVENDPHSALEHVSPRSAAEGRGWRLLSILRRRTDSE